MGMQINDSEPICTSQIYGMSPYLTPIDRQILELQKKGETAGEIADALDLSLGEVSRRMEAINKKLKSSKFKAHGPEFEK
jgi:DNA-binding NarL/FixJ family response regulator